MEGKRKRLSLALMFGLSLIILICFVTACGKTKTEIVNFADKTVTVEYGDTYAFTETSVKDTAGNIYKVSFSVKTKEGTAVEVVSNKFDVTDRGGYEAECSVTLDDGSVVTRIITINVIEIDGVLAGSFAEGLVAGDEVTVPQCRLMEKIGGTVLAENMSYSVSYYSEAVASNGGKFVAALTGVYTVTYSAEYNGKTYTKKFEVTVNRGMAKANEIESFDSVLSTNNFIAHNGTNKAEWLPSFGGESGVLKWTHSGSEWPAFSFVPRQEMSAYADYDYIIFRMYVEDVSSAMQYFRLINGDDQENEAVIGNSVKKGQWYDYVYNIDGFLKYWKNTGTDYETARLWSRSGSAGGTVYLADISVLKENIDYTGVKATVTGEQKEGQELTITLDNAPSEVTVLMTVYGPAGDAVTLDNGKLTAVPGEYKIVITIDGYYWKYTDTFTVIPAVDGELLGAFATDGVEGDEIDIPDMKLYNTLSLETLVAKMSYTVSYYGAPVSVSGGKFTADKSGVYVVTYSADYDGKIYTKTAEVTVNRGAPGTDEVESFDSPLSANGFLAIGGTNKVEWLETFEGEAGVIKWTHSGSAWPAFSFTQRREMSAYADYDYIVFRIYVTDTANAMQYFKLVNATPSYPEVAIGDSVKKGQWYDYTYDITGFLAYWTDNGQDRLTARLWSRCNNSGEGVVYIAEIFVLKGVESLDVSAIVAGDRTEGQELTITLGGEDAQGAAFKIYDPAGQEVVLTAGKFTATATGTYTVSITAEGCYGAKTSTFTIVPLIDGELLAEFAALIKENDEVDVPDMRLYNTLSDETLVAEMSYTVSYRGEAVAVTDDKFTARFAGVYVIAYTAEYGGETYAYSKEVTVYSENYAMYNNGYTAATVTADNSANIAFVDAAAIAGSEGNLPGLDGIDTGYIAVKAGGTSQWFNLTLPPQCNFADYSAADYMEVKLYISGSGSHGMHFKNNKITTVSGGSWQTVKIPLSIWKETQHGSFAYTAQVQMFDSVKTTSLFVFNGWSQNTTVYIAWIKLGNDTPDGTLNDDFAHLDAVSSNGTAEVTTYDNKDVVKVTGGTWSNIFITPGKTYEELAAYDKVIITLYIEGSVDVEFYSQAKLYGATDNDFVSYGMVTAGSWKTLEISMKRILDLHSGLYTGNNAFMIVRNKVFTAIYISDIVCV